jgi:hypothetical protein
MSTTRELQQTITGIYHNISRKPTLFDYEES